MRHEFEVVLGLILLFVIFIILAVWLLIAGMLFPALNAAVNQTTVVDPAITNPINPHLVFTQIQIGMGTIFLLCGIGTLVAILFMAFSNQPEEYQEYYQDQNNQYPGQGGW